MASTTVLVVDDEEQIADIYSVWLKAEYDVRTAYSGEEALEQFDSAVDIVLLDRRMPMSGDDVLVELRDRGFEGPVAMITAVEPEFDIVDMDFNAYIVKPVSRDDLLALVDQLASLSSYEDVIQQYFRLASKKGALEATKSPDDLTESDEFAQLERDIEDVSTELDEITADLDEADFENLMENLPPVKADGE